MTLTATLVKNLRPRTSRYTEWDGDGLGIRVSPAGTKSWVLVYHYENRARRLTLGRYPGMTLKRAREAAATARADLEKGIDPGAVAVTRRQQERQAETVTDLIEIYIEKWAQPRKKSWAEDQRILNKYVRPVWGSRKAASIKRKHVRDLLDGFQSQGMGVGANRIFATIRKMFNFAVERDIVEASPCAGVRPPVPERQRDRVLNLKELESFWRGLESAKMSPLTGNLFRLQLLTATRIGEVSGARWDEIDREERIWTIPADRSKNGIAHRIPLAPLALEVLEELRHASPDSPYLFPSPMRDGPVNPESMARALKTNAAHWRALGISHFTPHDLRRTAASHMTSIGVPRLVVSKILNHVESGVTAVYDRHGYDAEKLEALGKWADRVADLVGASAAQRSGLAEEQHG